MALFAFVDVREGIAAPSPEVAALLEISRGEPLMGRRLRGVGMWDLGRELFEVIVPSRLPAGLDLTADADLMGVLDVQAGGWHYKDLPVDLFHRVGAQETVTLNRPVDSPVPLPDPDAPDEAWEGVKIREPFALLVFFPATPAHRAARKAWRWAYRWATRRPRPQTWRRYQPPAGPVDAAVPGSAGDPAVWEPAGTPRIVADPAVMGGAPCVRGTRIPVVTVLGMLAEYSSPARVLADYRQLTYEDLRAVLRYAADALAPPSTIPDPGPGSGPAGLPS